MNARKVYEELVLLTLSVEEANFIQALAQNCIGEPKDEPNEQAEMRRHIFDVIKNLNLYKNFNL